MSESSPLDNTRRVLNYWQNTYFYDAARKPAFEKLLMSTCRAWTIP